MCQLCPVACRLPSASPSTCVPGIGLSALYLVISFYKALFWTMVGLPASHAQGHSFLAVMFPQPVVGKAPPKSSSWRGSKWENKTWNYVLIFWWIFLSSSKALVPPCCGAKTWDLSWRVGLESQVQPLLLLFPWKSIWSARNFGKENPVQLMACASRRRNPVSDKPGGPADLHSAHCSRIWCGAGDCLVVILQTSDGRPITT